MSLAQPGVLDAFAHDTRTDKLVLAMYEDRPWLGDDLHLLQLQEKVNAYLSFILDGEMLEAFPQFAGKLVEIQLRTVHEPEEKASSLIRRMREQLSFQKIGFEVIQIDAAEASAPSSCGCGEGGCCSN